MLSYDGKPEYMAFRRDYGVKGKKNEQERPMRLQVWCKCHLLMMCQRASTHI